MLDFSEKHTAIIKAILKTHVPDCEVRAYGSRVSGTSHQGSDLDLVVMGKESLGRKRRTGLKSAFVESNLPFSVDVLDWNDLPENFKENILMKFEVVQAGEG
jgi:uncharacterized protein